MWTGNEDFHQQRCNHPSAFRIPGPLQLDLPDMEPPVEKGALISSYRGRIDSSKNHQQLPDFFFLYRNLWWSEQMLFSGEARLTSGVTVYMETGRARDIRHCRDPSQGPEENETENVTGVFWHFALWESLKRFKRKLKSECGSWEYELPFFLQIQRW